MSNVNNVIDLARVRELKRRRLLRAEREAFEAARHRWQEEESAWCRPCDDEPPGGHAA